MGSKQRAEEGRVGPAGRLGKKSVRREKEQEGGIKESPRWERKSSCQHSLWHMSLPVGAPKDQGEGSWSSATFQRGRAKRSAATPAPGGPFQLRFPRPSSRTSAESLRIEFSSVAVCLYGFLGFCFFFRFLHDCNGFFFCIEMFKVGHFRRMLIWVWFSNRPEGRSK